MNENAFKNSIEKLRKLYPNDKMPKETAQEWLKTLEEENISAEILTDAVEIITRNSARPNRLPSLAEIMNACYEARHRHWEVIKKEKKGLNDVKQPKDVNYREKLDKIKAVLSHNISKQEFIAWMYSMEKREPKIGWKQCARKLEMGMKRRMAKSC